MQVSPPWGDIGAKTGNQTVSEESRLLDLARKQGGLDKIRKRAYYTSCG